MMRLVCFYIPLSFFLVACGSQVKPTQAPLNVIPSLIPVSPSPVSSTPTAATPIVTASPTDSQVTSCEEWQTLPIVPIVGERARELYRRGQEAGNHPRAFSKIGDGEISTEWFFTAFDLGEPYYDLGPYQDLQTIIDYFNGSFRRMGIAARRGFNTQRILDPSLSDSSICGSGESPLECEIRLHRPAFAILSLGTNQVWQPEEFEAGMRQILDILVSQNIVPILSTKGDNLEGDHRINHTIACLAQEYEVPLWNFWAAIQPLPNHGLQRDQEHLTYGITDFDDADALQTAWTIRNLTALQALDAVWRGVTTQP